ncbi:hypothetical protein COL93_26455, partial [Bacillus toyonensis]
MWKQKGFHTKAISSVLLLFLLCANIWFLIPIKMNAIKKETNEIVSPTHIYTKNYTGNWMYAIFYFWL